MKITIFLRYIGLLLIGLMAGSSLFFLIGLGFGTETLSADFRAEIQWAMGHRLSRWIHFIYIAFILVICTNLFFLRKQWKTLEFMLIITSLVCVVDDLVMTLVGNLPLTQGVQSWHVHSHWLNFMYIRCALLISSFIFLLASSYFMDRPKASPKGVFAVA